MNLQDTLDMYLNRAYFDNPEQVPMLRDIKAVAVAEQEQRENQPRRPAWTDEDIRDYLEARTRLGIQFMDIPATP